MVLPDGVLAYRFLHSANLKEDETKLCRATITEFKYKDMKQKVLSLCGDRVTKLDSSVPIKDEPVFYGNTERNDFYKSNRNFNNNNSRGRSRGAYGNRRGAWGGEKKFNKGREFLTPQKRTNLVGADGKPSHCAVCQSIYHWASQCPEIHQNQKGNDQSTHFTQNVRVSDENNWVEDNNISLYEKNGQMKQLVGETIGCAVVDRVAQKQLRERNGWNATWSCLMNMIQGR